MDGPGTDGSCGNPPVLSGGSNDDCFDGTVNPGYAATLARGGHVEGAANGTRRMKKRALEDGAISALLELNNTGQDAIAEVMVGGNRRKSPNRPHKRHGSASPAHCDGSGFSPVHGGHGEGGHDVYSGRPGSPVPGGGRHAKIKRTSNESVDAAVAAVTAAGHNVLPFNPLGMSLSMGQMGQQSGQQLASMGGVQSMGQMGQAMHAHMQQQYMQQYMQQQYMQGGYGYPWMPMMLPAAVSAHVTAPVAAMAATTPATAAAATPPRPATPTITGTAACLAAVVDSLPRRSAEKWGVSQVAEWLKTIQCEDLVPVVTSQDIDGMALKAIYRTGSSGMDVLHTLLRSEFPSAKSGHRLRLVEGLISLFALPGNTSRPKARDSAASVRLQQQQQLAS